MKKLKKGFTVVELVIVIAVIAILASVLIPVFSNLIKDAQESKDKQLIRNLNTSLSVARALDGNNKTMFDALSDAKTAGYDITKINKQRTQNEILWDQENDWFAYLNTEKNTVDYLPELNVSSPLSIGDYRLWKISNEIDSVYSTYYTGTGKEITTSKGFDAGDNANITSVNYGGSTEAQNVVIRTNSYDTVLTVNAENDTVAHYGKANTVNVEKVALKNCYSEFGDILGDINLKQGTVIVEEGCKATAVVIDMTTTELANVETISANNEKASYVPIILRTSKEDWGNNAHKDLIDPSKNNIIYTTPGASSIVYNDAGQRVTSEEITNVAAYNQTKDVYYMSMDYAINGAEENETVFLLKDDQVYHALSNNVNPIAKGVTVNLNGHLLKWEKDAWVIGENLTIKNGKLSGITGAQSYSCFFGDEEKTSVNLINLVCVGGLNFYNTTAVIEACNVSLNAGYNVIWADEDSDITIMSGKYDGMNRDNGLGVLGTSNNSRIYIYDGEFLSNGVEANVFLSNWEESANDYESESKGVFIYGGRYNINVSDFTFYLAYRKDEGGHRKGDVKEETLKEHVNLVANGYKCTKVGDLWVVSEN